MNTKSIGITLGLLLTGGSGIANATLLINGTFDTNLSGWTIDNATTTGVTWITGTAHVGRPGTPGIAIFKQGFDIPVGTTNLLISFDYEWQVVQPAIEDFFKAELIYETLSGPVTEELLNQGSNSGSFGTTVSFNDIVSLANLAAVSPNGEIRFTLEENNTPQGTRIQLDNVSVQVQIPEPATLALMGLGLIGIGYRRQSRRK